MTTENQTVSIVRFQNELQRAAEGIMKDTIQPWTEKFLKNPMDNLRWADTITESAQTYDLMLTLIGFCEWHQKNEAAERISCDEVKDWVKHLLDRTVDDVTSPSSSRMSNTMTMARLTVLRQWSQGYSRTWAYAFARAEHQELAEKATYVLRRTLVTTEIKRKKEVKVSNTSYLDGNGWWSSEKTDAQKFSFQEKEDMKLDDKTLYFEMLLPENEAAVLLS